jgi:opacity protein-like surface antigen
MKRIALAAVLAAAGLSTAAPAGAVPLVTQNACAIANAAAAAPSASCRFAGGNGVGVAGFSDKGYSITHKEKRAVVDDAGCAVFEDGVLKTEIVTVIDDSDSGQGPIGNQDSYASGVVFTLTILGNGEAQAGGYGSTPSPSEPADSAVDKTGDANVCTTKRRTRGTRYRHARR